jgi:hypothetical protein
MLSGGLDDSPTARYSGGEVIAMENPRQYSPEMQRLLRERAEAPPAPPSPPTDLDAFLASLGERFQPDRVNAQLWHCLTKEEFDREWDALRDPDEELAAQPELDGGNDGFFTDRN